MEGFLIRGLELIRPECGGTSALARGATITARWLHAGTSTFPERQLSPRAGSMSLSQLATSQLGWGFHTLRGGIDPGICVFVPGLLEL